MMEYRLSLPEAVRSIINDNYCIYHCLRLGIINYTALANYIKPQVERLVGSEVNTNSLVVAIKRYADTLEVEELEPINAKISLLGRVIDLDLVEDEDVDMFIDRLREMDPDLRLFRTYNILRIFTEEAEDVRELMDRFARCISNMSKGLAKISIKLPSNSKVNQVLITAIADALYNNGISVHDAFFSHDEIMLIVDEKDAGKAYDVLSRKLQSRYE
ncbi:MAG: hypothetical protein KatS3mg003_0167 [Candidatus Nitrosocaldaceae archaeon]|nr:MAG: hypothetical protein KatS3mg003_0167 [Candidatus Nitrosocaldaceae archaeon]